MYGHEAKVTQQFENEYVVIRQNELNRAKISVRSRGKSNSEMRKSLRSHKAK